MKNALKISLKTILNDYLISELIERLALIKFTPKKILLLENLNNYSELKNKLMKKYPKAEIIQVSRPPCQHEYKIPSHTKKYKKNNILNFFKQPYSRPFVLNPFVLSLFENLPFNKNSFDMVISNLEIFNSDLKKSLPELSRVLNQDGLLMLTLPGPDSFLELRIAMATMDSSEHIPAFPDMHDLGDQLVKANFKDPVLDTERFVLTARSIDEILNLIKKTHTQPRFIKSKNKFLYGKNKWSAWQKNYDLDQNNLYPIQLEINFAHAWGTHPRQYKDSEGAMRVSLEDLKASLPKRPI